jgi:hypothetical protein
MSMVSGKWDIFSIVEIIATVFLTIPCALQAQIPNGSFEEFDLNDPNKPLSWQIDPNGVPLEIRQSFSTAETPWPSNAYPPIIVEPFDGQYFILLKSDSENHRPLAATDFAQLYQTITVEPGQHITGVYFFSTGDYIPYDDFATIKLIPDPCSNPDPKKLTEITLAEKSVSDVGSYQTMPDWERFARDFNDAEAGTYTLVLRIEDAIDHIYTSRLAVDALKLCSPSPSDINKDCVVNFFDFAMLAAQWSNDCNDCNDPNLCRKSDIDHSRVVDFNDLLILAQDWLIDCDAEPNGPACGATIPEPPPQALYQPSNDPVGNQQAFTNSGRRLRVPIFS